MILGRFLENLGECPVHTRSSRQRYFTETRVQGVRGLCLVLPCSAHKFEYLKSDSRPTLEVIPSSCTHITTESILHCLIVIEAKLSGRRIQNNLERHSFLHLPFFGRSAANY